MLMLVEGMIIFLVILQTISSMEMQAMIKYLEDLEMIF